MLSFFGHINLRTVKPFSLLWALYFCDICLFALHCLQMVFLKFVKGLGCHIFDSCSSVSPQNKTLLKMQCSEGMISFSLFH